MVDEMGVVRWFMNIFHRPGSAVFVSVLPFLDRRFNEVAVFAVKNSSLVITQCTEIEGGVARGNALRGMHKLETSGYPYIGHMVTSESLREERFRRRLRCLPWLRRLSETCFEMKNYDMGPRCKVYILLHCEENAIFST